ncbi:capsular polysaccharide synthesis protein [Campylobacter coli]
MHRNLESFFSDYRVVILDYSNLHNFLPKDFYDESLYENFSLPKQADAIRAAVLYLYGGIWLDADTIITSSKIKYFFENPSNFSIFSSHMVCLKQKKVLLFVLIGFKNAKKEY